MSTQRVLYHRFSIHPVTQTFTQCIYEQHVLYHTSITQPSRVIRGSVSCPRTLLHTEWRRPGSNCHPLVSERPLYTATADPNIKGPIKAFWTHKSLLKWWLQLRKVSRPLNRWAVGRSLALSVYILNCPWARYWTPNCRVWYDESCTVIYSLYCLKEATMMLQGNKGESECVDMKHVIIILYLQLDRPGHETWAEDPGRRHAPPGHLPTVPQRHQAAPAGRAAAAEHRQVLFKHTFTLQTIFIICALSSFSSHKPSSEDSTSLS